jgi:hypothetical protein
MELPGVLQQSDMPKHMDHCNSPHVTTGRPFLKASATFMLLQVLQVGLTPCSMIRTPA